MKRILATILCLVLAACLIACTPTDTDPNKESTPSPLLVGFGREDITPEYSVPMGGYPSNLGFSSVMDPVYATCVAFTDSENNTILLYHLDLMNAGGPTLPFTRKAVSKATGIPIDNIMLTATHTHSAPNTSSSNPIMEDYYDFLEEQMLAAAQAALADRKPAEMYTATTTLQNMNFVRHYYMSDGSVAGSNFGKTAGNSYVKHVKDVDNEMQLIRFKRDGGKDVVLVNWQTHPIRNSNSYSSHISADVVGSMRMALEPQMDCYMAYFSGGSGNVEPASRISSENITSDYMEQGAMMAQAATLACDNMTRQKVGKVQIFNRKQEVKANDNTLTINSYAFSIGDVAFVTAPYEMFDTNGKFIKDNSPFEMTFVATCANGYGHYVAAEWAYDYDSYEVNTGGYNKGTAEALADGYVEMLNEIYPTRGTVENTGTNAKETASLYYNLDMGAELKADANGTYTVSFLHDGKQVALKVTDKAMLDSLQNVDFVGLQLDGDTVTRIVHMPDMPYSRVAWNYCIQSLGGNTVKLTSPDGQELLLNLPDGTPIYDAVPGSSTFGAATTLQKNDYISVIADENGTPVFVYVHSKSAASHEGLLYCEHCKKEVSWLDWLADSSLPTSTGHYLLSGDVKLTGTTAIDSGNICLDLNGKTVTQTAYAKRIFALAGNVTLSIMDSAGGGRMIPTSTSSTAVGAKNGMIIHSGSTEVTVNLYSGTLDASNATAQYGVAISQEAGTFNMYGGEILAGTSYGNGGGALRMVDTFNMYGGRIAGGKLNTTHRDSNPPGGATVRCAGTMTMYGGIIEGGESFAEGGVIYASSAANAGVTPTKLILKGGTITGGKATLGGGIYVGGDATVIISGDVKITGSEGDNLYLAKGATVSIGEEGLGENTRIGITMEEAGTFATAVPAGVEISKHFVSDDASKKIVSTGSGSWGLK